MHFSTDSMEIIGDKWVYYENVSIIYFTTNSIFHARTKHVKNKFLFCSETYYRQENYMSYKFFSKLNSKHVYQASLSIGVH